MSYNRYLPMVGTPWGWSSSIPWDRSLSPKETNTLKTKKIQQVFSGQCMFQVFSHTQTSPFFPNKSPSCFSTPLSAWLTNPRDLPRWPSPRRGSRDLYAGCGWIESPRFVVSFWGGKNSSIFLHLIQGGFHHPMIIKMEWNNTYK